MWHGPYIFPLPRMPPRPPPLFPCCILIGIGPRVDNARPRIPRICLKFNANPAMPNPAQGLEQRMSRKIVAETKRVARPDGAGLKLGHLTCAKTRARIGWVQTKMSEPSGGGEGGGRLLAAAFDPLHKKTHSVWDTPGCPISPMTYFSLAVQAPAEWPMVEKSKVASFPPTESSTDFPPG